MTVVSRICQGRKVDMRDVRTVLAQLQDQAVVREAVVEVLEEQQKLRQDLARIDSKIAALRRRVETGSRQARGSV